MREDNRQARRLDALHVQSLTSQLREAQTELRGLHKDVHALQRELDRESRRADNAERDLRMYEMMHRGTNRGQYNHSMPSRSSGHREYMSVIGAAPGFTPSHGRSTGMPEPLSDISGPLTDRNQCFDSMDQIHWSMSLRQN
jgi:hypothetical protein